MIRLERSSELTLGEQVAAALRRAIGSGKIPSSNRLPSTRTLARQLGISRNTVLEAYEILCAENWIEARTGSGTRVATRIPTADFLRASQYPNHRVPLNDPDGTPIYIRY